MSRHVEERLRHLNITMVHAPTPVARYRTWVAIGDLVYLSGHGPIRRDGSAVTGRLGEDVTMTQGREAARQTGVNMLATLKSAMGSLDRIKRVVKLLGFVQCTEHFHDQPKVIDGCSELFFDVFGEAGVGVRSAVGCNSLPGHIAVEIEGVFQVTDAQTG